MKQAHSFFVKAASIAALLLCSACCSAMSDSKGEEMVAWDSVPAAVQKTITDNAAGNPVDKVEKETRDGTTLYEAKVKKANGSRLVIKVGEDAKLIGVIKKSAETTVSFSKLPKSVRATITKEASGQKVAKVEKETVDGKLIYEATVPNADGTRLIIKVGKTGTLISTKTKQ